MRRRWLAIGALSLGCAGAGLDATMPTTPSCRARDIELVDAYRLCVQTGATATEPDASELEVSTPESLVVVSGGRTAFVVALRNVSDHVLPLAFAPDLSASVGHAGRRVDAICVEGADAKDGSDDAALVVIELLPGGVLRIPMQITAWGTVSEARDRDCTLASETARGPLPSGDYEALLRLPWGWSRSVALTIAPRTASLGSDWPRGETRLTCTADDDCALVSGPCPAQSVARAFAQETQRLHEALASRGACVPEQTASVARCLDSFCARGEP